MRFILKIILFPISLILSILTTFLTFLLGIGTALLYIVMMLHIWSISFFQSRRSRNRHIRIAYRLPI